MTGRHTAEIPVRGRLGSEVQPFWLAPRPPQPGDLLRPLTLPPDDPHGFIDLVRRVVKVAAYTVGSVVLVLLGVLIGVRL